MCSRVKSCIILPVFLSSALPPLDRAGYGQLGCRISYGSDMALNIRILLSFFSLRLSAFEIDPDTENMAAVYHTVELPDA